MRGVDSSLDSLGSKVISIKQSESFVLHKPNKAMHIVAVPPVPSRTLAALKGRRIPYVPGESCI